MKRGGFSRVILLKIDSDKMSWLEIILMAFCLSADAFAVSIVVGGTPFKVGFRPMFRIAFHFGLFQFLMPILGWFIGWKVASYVETFDHWIAFTLLVYVGSKMVYDGFKGEELVWSRDPSRKGILVVLSLATSIDAFALGFSLSMLRVDIWVPSIMIGVITAILCSIGMYFGRFLGVRFGQKMTVAGGGILWLLGVKILLEHLFTH